MIYHFAVWNNPRIEYSGIAFIAAVFMETKSYFTDIFMSVKFSKRVYRIPKERVVSLPSNKVRSLLIYLFWNLDASGSSGRTHWKVIRIIYQARAVIPFHSTLHPSVAANSYRSYYRSTLELWYRSTFALKPKPSTPRTRTQMKILDLGSSVAGSYWFVGFVVGSCNAWPDSSCPLPPTFAAPFPRSNLNLFTSNLRWYQWKFGEEKEEKKVFHLPKEVEIS